MEVTLALGQARARKNRRSSRARRDVGKTDRCRRAEDARALAKAIRIFLSRAGTQSF